jgi:hypothetical protein
MLFTFIMLAPNAHAELQGNPWVATYDTNDNPETQFALGETVRIKAFSHVTPYYIYVYEPDATLKMTIGPINTTSYSGDYGNITTNEGWWTLFILDTSAHYGVGQYFVIPVTPLGVATALSACFAGLGVRRLRRTKK